jgi:hypothetical protein
MGMTLTEPAMYLRVDPSQPSGTQIVYATYLGGPRTSGFVGIGTIVDSMTADTTGHVYVLGSTSSTSYPTRGAFQTSFSAGNLAGFIREIDTNAGGQAGLVWSTFLGDGTNVLPGAICVDISGNVYVAGQFQRVAGTKFPITSGAFQGIPAATNGAFLTEFDSNGHLLYSSTFGQSTFQDFTGLAVARPGLAWLDGFTSGTGFSTTSDAFQPTFLTPASNPQFPSNGIIAEVNTGLTGKDSLVFGSYVGGSTTTMLTRGRPRCRRQRLCPWKHGDSADPEPWALQRPLAGPPQGADRSGRPG